MIYKNNIFWVIILASILTFYLITRHNINSLINENNSLNDSLKTLQEQLKYLDSLLLDFDALQNPLNTSFRDTIIQEAGSQIKVRFIPETKDADRYVWNFDDGGVSQDKEPLHIFKTDKKLEFYIKLQLFKGNLRDSSSKLIKFGNSENLDAKFDTAITIIRSFYVRLKFIPVTQNADSYEWNFGDGQSSKLKEPLHEYDLNKSREFQVILTIKKNDNSAQSRKFMQFPIGQHLDANFNWKIIDSNTNKVKFIPNTQDAETYEWSFGDNNKSNEKEPEHIYNTTTNHQFTVTLKITKGGSIKEFRTTITLKKHISLSVKLPKYNFCTDDKNDYLFELNPPGGKVSGRGVKFSNNRYYFNPSLVETPGNFKIVYEVNGKNESLEITVTRCQQKVTFTLPQNEFYICDTNLYIFRTEPPGGVVKGNGVIQKASVFYFKPSVVETARGRLTFSYNLPDTTVNYSITLQDISPLFSTDSTNNGETIIFRFNASEKNADDYIWTVNGREVAHNSSYNVTYKAYTSYDFKIKLTVKKKGCSKSSPEKHFQYYYIG
jgi:hypothetical protein